MTEPGNDGRYAALTPHELVMALNRTYEYIGGKVITAPASSQPVGQANRPAER